MGALTSTRRSHARTRSDRIPPPQGGRARVWLWVLLAASAWLGCFEPQDARPHRIILISMDTVRASEVNGYGGASTPALKGIADQGVLFANAYASSTFTIPSHASIFTGLHPLEHGVRDEFTSLPESVPTLAESLRQAGYRTQGFHEGGYMHPRFGFARGFDSYKRVPRVAAVTERLPDVLEWMRAQGDRPYFLFLHTYAAHNPYGGYSEYRDLHPEARMPTRDELLAVLHDEAAASDPEVQAQLLLFNQLCETDADRLEGIPAILPQGYEETPAAASHLAATRWAYRRRIRQIDDAIARIRDVLEQQDQWRDTLLVVTSDHGEAFFEHHLPWHGYVPFDEVLKIPLIVSYPHALKAAAGRVETTVVSHEDLLPTILGFARIPNPTRGVGVDLRPILEAPGLRPVTRSVFSVVQEVPFRPDAPAREVVIDGRHKLIEGSPRFGDDSWLLFDLENDPGEHWNVFDERPDVRGRMLASLAARRRDRRKVERGPSGVARPLAPDEEHELKTLGYGE